MVIVVPCPQWAERILLDRKMPCPRCRGVLRPCGHGGMGTVRAAGAGHGDHDRRRARCSGCAATHVLLGEVLGGNTIAAVLDGLLHRSVVVIEIAGDCYRLRDRQARTGPLGRALYWRVTK